MKSQVRQLLILTCAITIITCSLAEAKPSIDLVFEKNNGYGVGDKIGGLWTVTATVSSNVQYVEFYLDDQLQQNDTNAPFSWQFDTTNYSVGSHVIKAVAYDSLGETAFLQVARDFQRESTQTITIIIIAVVTLIVIAAVGFALYMQKAKK